MGLLGRSGGGGTGEAKVSGGIPTKHRTPGSY